MRVSGYEQQNLKNHNQINLLKCITGCTDDSFCTTLPQLSTGLDDVRLRDDADHILSFSYAVDGRASDNSAIS